MPLWSSLHGELVRWKGALFEAPLYLLILLTALGGIAAYQSPAYVHLDVGGIHDAPYLNSFHHPEPDRQQVPNPDLDFRWTRERVTIDLPGIGQRAVEARLRLQAYRPAGVPTPTISFRSNGVPLSTAQIGSGWQVYHLLIPGPILSSGGLALELQSETFQPPNDPRQLGVTVDWVELRPAAPGWTDPDWAQIGSVAGAVALLYLLLRRLGLNRPWSGGLGLTAVALLITLLATHRLSLTPFTPTLVLVLAWGCLLTAVLLPLMEAWIVGRGGALREARLLWALLLAGSLLRMGGMLYPQFRSSDLIFHAHRADWVGQGTLLFTADLPDINMPAPYPPGLYLSLLPGTLLLHQTPLLMQMAGVILNAAAGLLLYLLARRLSGRVDVALLALLVQELAPITYRIYSWGNYTNLFSRVALLGVLYVLCLGRWRRGQGRGWLLLTGTSALVFLGHFADSLLFALFVMAVAGLAVLTWTGRQLLPRLLGAFLSAGAIALGLYYSAPPGWEALLNLGALFVSGARSIEATPSLAAVAAQLLQEQIPAAVIVTALPGLALWWVRCRRRWPAVVIGGALLTAAAFFFGQVRFGLSSRYSLFILPVLALGTAELLAAWWRRGRTARWVTALLLAYLTGYGLWSWWWLVGFGQR